jgi:hypothetical protein
MAQNPNIDDATRARASRFAADKSASAPAAKPRVVSKKELEASGLSLRDFMNKERGLTRRKSADPTAGEAKDKAAQTAADKIDPGNDGGESVVRRQDAEAAKKAKDMSSYKSRGSSSLSDVVRPGTSTNYENTDTSDMGMKRGGKVKKMASGGSVSASRRADGIAQRGKTRA